MKTKIHAAIIIAVAASIVSCGWFKHKNEQANKSPLTGKYQVVSIMDSSLQHKLKPTDTLSSFFNCTVHDSLPRYVDFSSDSLVTYETEANVDSTTFYTETAAKTVYLKNDSIYEPFNIIERSDSSIDLFAANDSVYISLKKL